MKYMIALMLATITFANVVIADQGCGSCSKTSQTQNNAAQTADEAAAQAAAAQAAAAQAAATEANTQTNAAENTSTAQAE